MNTPTLKHAYFSAQAAYLSGSNIYAREDGSEVEITCVCDDPDWVTENYLWKDTVYVGRVAKWVRRGEVGTQPFASSGYERLYSRG